MLDFYSRINKYQSKRGHVSIWIKNCYFQGLVQVLHQALEYIVWILIHVNRFAKISCVNLQ